MGINDATLAFRNGATYWDFEVDGATYWDDEVAIRIEASLDRPIMELAAQMERIEYFLKIFSA